MFEFSLMNSVIAALWDVTKGAWLTAGLLLLVRLLFQKLLTPKAKYYLWFLLVLRLMLPVVPESNLSLMNFFSDIQTAVVSVNTSPVVDPIDVSPVEYHDEVYADLTVSSTDSSEQTHIYTTNWTEAVFYVWFSGAFLLVLIYLTLYIVTALHLRRYPDCQDCETLTRFRILKSKMGIHRNVRLAMGSGGMLGGLLRPTLVLPAEVYGAAAEPIIIHELTHQRCKDGWLYLLFRIITVFHWFNPTVWLCFHLAKQDSELACDQRVLDSDLVSVRDYLAALVEQGLLSRRRNILMHTRFATTRKRYVSRIREIARYGKKRPLAIILSAMLVILICLLSLTGKTYAPEPQEVIELPCNSYVSMTEVDGTLYLVDLSGNIVTMDWYTGETELFCKSPGGFVEWTSDQSLSHLYYIDGDTLCRLSTATQAAETLCPLPNLQKIFTVTENCVFYCCLTEDDILKNYVLNLSTMESQELIFDESDTLVQTTWMPGTGDNLYVALNYNDRNDRVEKWNLLTGEHTVLFEHMNNITMLTSGTVTGNVLYFQIGDFIYTMPADGSSEATQIPSTLSASYHAVHCGDDSLIFRTVNAHGGVTKRYDPITGLTTRLPHSEDAGLVYAAVSGNRYATMTQGHGILLISDIS